MAPGLSLGLHIALRFHGHLHGDFPVSSLLSLRCSPLAVSDACGPVLCFTSLFYRTSSALGLRADVVCLL